MLIDIKNLSKSYNKEVLSKVNMNISQGEIVSIIGPSGAGKSTLIKIINNLETMDQGEIYLEGRLISKNSKVLDPKAYRKIGLVFQDYKLFPHLTVLENISLSLIKVFNINKDEAEKLAKEQLEDLDILEKAYDYPAYLSGGEKQRLALARSLVQDPDLICLDEPTSALDPKSVLNIEKIIERLKNRGKAVLIISHDINLARRISDRLYFLDQGKLFHYYREDFTSLEEGRLNKFITG